MFPMSCAPLAPSTIEVEEDSVDETGHIDRMDNDAGIDAPSDRRTLARQHTAKMLQMLRGYGPKEPPSTAEPRMAVVTELTSVRSSSLVDKEVEPLAADECTPTTVADARACYVRLVEESPDQRLRSSAASAVPALRAPVRFSVQQVASLGDGLRQQQTGVLGRLIAQTSKLEQSSRIFQAYLPPHLREHAILIRMDQEAWTVRTDSASWATRLRYKLYDIRQALGQQLGIALPKPHIRVEPVATPSSSRRSLLTLTRKNARLIEQTARDEADPRLSAALLRLAQHTAPDDA
jgi:hypothetical protein